MHQPENHSKIFLFISIFLSQVISLKPIRWNELWVHKYECERKLEHVLNELTYLYVLESITQTVS